MKWLSVIVIFALALMCCDDEQANNAPVIVLLLAEPDSVGANSEVEFTCLATDSDGDLLTYWWTSNEGQFIDIEIGSNVTWRAPFYLGTYTVTANVSDGKVTQTGDLDIVVHIYPAQEGRDFADEHFNEMDYRNKEYELARSAAWGDSGAYGGSYNDWFNEPWSRRVHYLPREGFEHDLPTESDRNENREVDIAYYEYIGYYLHQFGFGWSDAFGDDPATPYFDGDSPNARFYADNWLQPR